VEVTIDEKHLPEPPARRIVGVPDPVYLIVRSEGKINQSIAFRSSILTSGDKATVITGVREIQLKELDRQVGRVKNTRFNFRTVGGYGEKLSEMVLATEIRAVLPKRKDRSGKYDVIHYAGHAYFDAHLPSRSGILCHGREVLSGAELAGLGNLPGLVFFNAHPGKNLSPCIGGDACGYQYLFVGSTTSGVGLNGAEIPMSVNCRLSETLLVCFSLPY